ncbi:hypothetical protein [Amycolatopsis sp. H20-H5]|nr:hypothetical protein [Amycolatopsis sp. H20-H5]MEC3982140.1 hypothetical protein [Amycolatopsis sp. H20-H5]
MADTDTGINSLRGRCSLFGSGTPKKKPSNTETAPVGLFSPTFGKT